MADLSLADECYFKLRSLILTCGILPGARVTEKELIERTGFGRTPVREALARLDVEGLIETRPRSGYKVSDVNEKTVVDHFNVWKVIGPLIVKLAAENITEEFRERIDEVVSKLSTDASVEDILLYNQRAFELMAEATGNQNLVFIHKRLGSEQHRVFALFLNSEEGKEWIMRQKRFWLEEEWYRDPEVAEARITFAIMSSLPPILDLVKKRSANEKH